MSVILFLAAILFAIPTAGLSLLAFVIYLLARSYLAAKVRVYEVDRRAAERAIDDAPGLPGPDKDAPDQPSWYNTQMEKTFFDGVSKIGARKGVPLLYIAHGFANPDTASMLFRFAAVMESRGRSFMEQQMGVAEFIAGSWGDLNTNDQRAFLASVAAR
jgi:hypothetical protein